MSSLFRLLSILIVCISFTGCSYFECDHSCGIYETSDSVSHHFGDGQYNWIMNSHLEFSQEEWQHKLTILNYRQSPFDVISNNFFVYDASVPKGKTSVYRHTVDSIIKLMHNADSSNSKYTPTKNKQLIMKYFYFTLGVEPFDSMQFSSFISRILGRADNLKSKNPNLWSKRIQALNALHKDIKDLYQGCSKFEYYNGYNNEKDSISYLYFDSRHSTFIKLTYMPKVTTQLLFRPTNHILLTRNEEAKENCTCCKWWQKRGE